MILGACAALGANPRGSNATVSFGLAPRIAPYRWEKSICDPSCTGVPDESTMILRILPLRTTHAARLCWIAIARPRTRYTATSRVAERRDAATHVHGTARTDLVRRTP